MVAAMMGGFGWGSDLLTCVNSQVSFKRVEIFNEDWAGRVVVSESDFYIKRICLFCFKHWRHSFSQLQMHSLFTNHKFSYAFLNYFKVLLCFVKEQSGVHRIVTKIY